MVAQEIRVRNKGQVTLPSELRQEMGLEDGDRLLWDLVDGRIVLTRPEDIVRRTAGIFSEYAKHDTVEIDRDAIWGEIATERERRILQQVAEESDSYDPD